MSRLANPSLLLLRNEEELTGERILVINTMRDGFLRELKQLNPNSDIHAFSYNVADHQDSQKHKGITSHVGHSLPVLEELDLVIYYYPKSKPEALMMLDNIRAIASPKTRVLIVGDNKGGVKSAEKQFKQFAGEFYKLENAKHCVLFEFADLTLLDGFDISSYQTTFTVSVNDQSFEVASVPGVFNHGKLDDGTRLLLEQIAVPYKGKVLDFGCGAGIIATYLGLKTPELRLNCLDVSALAVYATEQTLKRNNLEGNVILSDGMQAVSGQFDLIISNPPFHTGISTDYQIAEDFLALSKQFLKPKGKLTIVANSFLKYQPILEAQFGEYETIAKNNKFAVYHAQKS